jgi:hypothetical protein
MVNIRAPAHPEPKKYNSAQSEYTNEHLRTKKTFAQVICVFAYEIKPYCEAPPFLTLFSEK